MRSRAAPEVSLVVNGVRHALRVDPDMPLLYVLRNELGLVGTRFGCGVGVCGSCTVLVGSAAVRSCQIPVGTVGQPVRTVEDLGGEHPVQRALLEEQAGQCGYCLSGIVMAAVALLERSPHPDEDEMRAALDENICRCGSQPRILRALRRAAGAA